jgi:hypothetical protein
MNFNMGSIGEIMTSLDSVNEVLSSLVVEFREYIESCQEKEMTDAEILQEINNYWDNKFDTLESAIEWYNNLGI